MINLYQLLLPFLSLYMYDYMVYEYVYSSVCKYLWPYIWVQSPEHESWCPLHLLCILLSLNQWIWRWPFFSYANLKHVSFRDPLLFVFSFQHWDYRCIRSYTAHHMDAVDLNSGFHAMQWLQLLTVSSPSPAISLRQHKDIAWVRVPYF